MIADALLSPHFQILRENSSHWDTYIYFEMFLGGIAAGAYLVAAILELLGRGRSAVARAAHLLTFPLMALVGLILIVDLSRPERFWHMVVMSEQLLPMFKTWSVMSMGTWLVLLFSGFSFVSFVDAVLSQGRRERGLHGSGFGRIWAIVGAVLGLGVASYSGTLLRATNYGGWADSPLIGPLFVATAGVTGAAALLLIQALRGQTNQPEVQGLARASTFLVIWQVLLLVLFIATAAAIAPVFLSGLPLAALIGAVVLVVLALLTRLGGAGRRPAMTGLFAAMLLVGGLLVRYAVVMGPQQGHFIPGAG